MRASIDSMTKAIANRMTVVDQARAETRIALENLRKMIDEVPMTSAQRSAAAQTISLAQNRLGLISTMLIGGTYGPDIDAIDAAKTRDSAIAAAAPHLIAE